MSTTRTTVHQIERDISQLDGELAQLKARDSALAFDAESGDSGARKSRAKIRERIEEIEPRLADLRPALMQGVQRLQAEEQAARVEATRGRWRAALTAAKAAQEQARLLDAQLRDANNATRKMIDRLRELRMAAYTMAAQLVGGEEAYGFAPQEIDAFILARVTSSLGLRPDAALLFTPHGWEAAVATAEPLEPIVGVQYQAILGRAPADVLEADPEQELAA